MRLAPARRIATTSEVSGEATSASGSVRRAPCSGAPPNSGAAHEAHNGRMVEVEHIGEYQSYSPQPEDFYMVQTAEWAKGFALRKAEELIEWTKTHGLKREL